MQDGLDAGQRPEFEFGKLVCGTGGTAFTAAALLQLLQL